MNAIREPEQDQTVPPLRALRFDRPADLYRDVREIAQFMQQRPFEEEDALHYFERLRDSSTPEEAITYTAFATEPAVAISWTIEAIRVVGPDLSEDDSVLMELIERWFHDPRAKNRWKVMQVALFAPHRSATVNLGLAVGWSGGALAPNDPVTVPAWRSAKAANAAILRALGEVDQAHRSENLARVLDLAAGLFRVYDA